ncbi:MAG: HAD-IG family 5'-nucleotidase [Planctomycetes bacterium]|nr:HAD-IG family 5'-nucleotidase [Planctomycetota bacterium]
MLRIKLNISLLSVILMSSAVFAQVDPDEQVPAKPTVPQSAREAAGLTGSRTPRRNLAKDIRLIKQFEVEISRALELDEESAEEVSEVFREYIGELAADTESDREAKRERTGAIRELVDEMRDAQKDRDTERVQELREEISELRGTRDDQAEPRDHEALYEEIRELLNEEQLGIFDPLADRFTKRLNGSRSAARSKLRLYRSATNALDLSGDQRANVRRLFVEASKEQRAAKAKGVSTEESDAILFDALLDELDEDQVKDFTRKVADLEKMQNRGKKNRPIARERGEKSPGLKELGRELSGGDSEGDDVAAEQEENEETEEPAEEAEDPEAEEEEN